MRPGEVVISQIKRHPIGLITMYASFAFLLVLVGVVAVIAPSILTDYDQDMVSRVGMLAFVISLFFSALFALVGQYVYNGNRWIITSDSLTQVAQNGIFDRHSSQLSFGNLEDVTVQQDGIMAHLFNYGVLKAETAGERSKFMFIYCPNPNMYAQKILVARENFEQGKLYAEQRPDHTQSPVPPDQYQQPPQPPVNPAPPTPNQ